MKILAECILFALLLSANAHGQGIILWDESVNGPLSQDFTTPTSLSPVQAGINSIIGKTEVVPVGNNWFGSPDFFTFSIPQNLVVSALSLSIDRPNVSAWIGDVSYANQLALAGSPVSGNLLPQWGLTSIGSGNYGIYMDNHDQQAVTSIATYRLDFFVENVPEPSTVSLALVGLGLLGVRRWKAGTNHK